MEFNENKNLSEIDAQPKQWFTLYNHILFQSGFFEVITDEDNTEYSENRIRIMWLQYCLGKLTLILYRNSKNIIIFLHFQGNTKMICREQLIAFIQ